MPDHKTAIITGASRGIGAGLVEAFLKQGYNVVATSRNVSQQLTATASLVLVDGDIWQARPQAWHTLFVQRGRLSKSRAERLPVNSRTYIQWKSDNPVATSSRRLKLEHKWLAVHVHRLTPII